MKAVKTFVKKNANTITTVLTVVSIAATVVAFSTGIGEAATVAGGVALGIDTAFTAMNASNAITGHDLLTGAPLSNGSRVLNGVLAVAGVAAPFAAPLISKGVGKVVQKVSDSKVGAVATNIFSKSKYINPNSIRYSQKSVNGSQDIVDSMKTNGWKGDPIDVVRMKDSKLTTLDNTRGVAARKADINVKANVHGYNGKLSSEMVERFTTKQGVPKTWGDAADLRIAKQGKTFKTNYPQGSWKMNKIK